MTGDRPDTHDPAVPRAAMLLTAGLGTRLRPLTRLCAKPALPVAGEPLAGRILRWLAGTGVRDAVLNLHHRPETITAAVGDGTRYGLRVRYSWEPEILGSAGGPARALPILNAERFLLVNGDTLSNVDLGAMAAVHAASGARVTMAVIPNPDPAHYGGVLVDAGACVTGFAARGPGNRGLHFIGIQIVEADVFAGLDPAARSDTVGGVYDDLISRHPGDVRAFVSQASFRDIGTAAHYLTTCLDAGRAAGCGDLIVEDGASVDSRAALSQCVIWPGSLVPGDVTLDACIVAGGAAVPAGSRFSRCVLRPAAGADEREPFERQIGTLLVSPLDVLKAEIRCI
ncbi:MAG: sugar phosphate nucleotidyltransferase [Acidobacteriota bacterium]